MKIAFKNSLLLFVLQVGIGSELMVRAQTFTVLHSFSGASEGVGPSPGLVAAGNTLFGVTYQGGSTGNGTIFSVNTDGTDFRTIYTFSAGTGTLGGFPYVTNTDGAGLAGGLISSGNKLYGTAAYGGNAGNGTLFVINTDGTGFTVLYRFSPTTGAIPYFFNSDGANPSCELTLSGNTLYGTAMHGGTSGYGTVFAVNTDGSGFATLHTFTAGSGSFPYVVNSDGAFPLAGLVLSGSTLFGTTKYGGSSGNGTVFAVNVDGSGFTNLYSFSQGSGAFPNIINNDGANPTAGVTVSGNIVYGAARYGGGSGSGTLFNINADGSGFSTLYTFSTGAGTFPYVVNSDGAYPPAGVILSSNTFYGITSFGGSSGNGTLFAINTDGSGFSSLYSFTASSGPNLVNTDGIEPLGLILSGQTLYGTAYKGGGSGYGTLFSFSLGPVTGVNPPQLTITPGGESVLVSWLNNFSGFTLQSTTNLASPVWTTNLPAPVIVNGQFTVTNPIFGTQQFFRLSQ